VRTFFTGVGPRSFSNGINSAIFFCFFEIMRSSLRKWEDNRKTLPTGVLVENYHGSAR
jgi:solute carrier family 25 S-adenosylmethionine transporter 26